MAGKPLVETTNPVSQSVEAVQAFLSWRKMPTSPMPSRVELGGDVVLVLSSKKNAYYTTTANDCSCPARCYHPDRRCKHMKANFGELELVHTTNFKPVLE